jgi:uncharacterized protein (TIGR02594 family)
MAVSKPNWVIVGEGLIGVREIPGVASSPVIVGWLIRLKAWWRDDLTPWCGVFVAFCLLETGIRPPAAWYRAKAYLEWGTPLAAPAYGCIVVFNRAGGGHVGFVVGKDEHGRLMVLGGNQGDRVSIAPFDMSRVAGYRLPPGAELPPDFNLPLIRSFVPSSKNEA